LITLAGLLVATLAAPLTAGITVTSYQTVALTNAWAPLSQDQYFERQALTNVSPAVADVAGDWTGPNAGGTTPTWHFLGSAHTTSKTVADSSSLGVTVAGSFSYEITTTADFIDPRSSSIFTPSGAANYEGFFNTDLSTTYRMSAQLNQWSRVRLNALDGSVVFDQINFTTSPVLVDRTGPLPPGQYRILITASLAASNLPNGVNDYVRDGSYESATFTVQVPEPSTWGITLAMFVGYRGCVARGAPASNKRRANLP
jgi:hypothetical protein